MATPATPPTILRAAISTFYTEHLCSSDKAIVQIIDHRARCAYGHRWVKTDAGWQSVGRE